MNETVFENMAENLKSNIAKDIAYTYSVFVSTDAETNTLFKMKSNILLPDRKYIIKLLKSEDNERLIFPCDVLEKSIEKHIEEFYSEFELSLKISETLEKYGNSATLFKKRFTENVEKLKKEAKEEVFRQLNFQIMLGSDVKSVIDSVDGVLSRQTNALKRFLRDSAGQLGGYMLLWDWYNMGFTRYRYKTIGGNCKECDDLDDKIFLIEQAEFGVNLAPMHFNCNCATEILDDAGNVVFTTAKTTEGEEQKQENDVWDYLKTSLKQIVYGNFTDDVNLLGTLGQIALGLLGFDLPADIRDLLYDISNFKLTPEHAIQTILDIIALLPVVGSVKYVDEAGEVLKIGTKNADEVADVVKVTVKNSDKLEKAEDLIQFKYIVNNVGQEIDVTPSRTHFILRKNPGYMGVPETSVDIIDEAGEVVTRRWYDEYGKAVRDVDFTNHGNAGTHPEWPHEHIWKYSDDGEPIRQ